MSMSTKTVIVASTNPVKIEAMRNGLAQMFPGEAFEVTGIATQSGVPDQPMSDAETYQGALNRANNAALAVPRADLWAGIEGGLEAVGESLQGFAWVVVRGRDKMGKSRTATHILPDEVARLVRDGQELGHANDVVFQRRNSKQANGSVGLLTGDALTRTVYYEQAVILALIPFKNDDLTFL